MILQRGPLVSVITPVYNGERYLPECIESVLRQSYDHIEYVILDNASGDATRQIAERYARQDPRVRLYHHDSTLPFIENWNRALQLMSRAAGYCKVVHADDWLYPECLTRMVELAESDRRVGIVGSYVQRGDRIACRWPDAPGPVIAGREVARLSLLGRIPYIFGSPSSLLLRAGLVRERPEFYCDENLSIMRQVVDQDVCYRLLRGNDFGYVEEPLTFTRLHHSSMTSDNERLNRWFAGKIMLLMRHGKRYLTRDEYDRRLGTWMHRYYRFLGKNVFRGRGAEFWSFHRDALEQLGMPLQSLRLLGAAASQLYRRAQQRVGAVAPVLRGASP